LNYRRLGSTGLKVSEFSLGSWTTLGGSVDEAASAAIVRRAFERGINLFDTADVYVKGGAERALGAAIRDLPREQLVIATKVMGRVWDGPLGAGLSRKHVFDAMDQSLRRLGVDYVDLYQAHAPDKDTPIEETLEAFEDLVRAGKTRYIGVSNFDRDPPLLRRAIAHQMRRGWSRFVSSQPRYSLLDRHVEGGGRPAADGTIHRESHAAVCRANGIGLIVYSPLAQGVLTNKYAGGAVPAGSRAAGTFAHFMSSEKQHTPENVAAAERLAAWAGRHGSWTPAQIALAWVLRHEGVSSVILGATSVAQLEENLVAADVRLDEGQWREVEEAIAGPAAAGAPSRVAPRSRTKRAASSPRRPSRSRSAGRT
jgi:aryl-alcohol dehydrogenase-like predicted oxidoreductase